MHLSVPDAQKVPPSPLPQHGSPPPPHAVQTLPLAHVVNDPVQPAAQQFSPAAPHNPHPASGHAPPQLDISQRPLLGSGHTEPADVQTPLTQQPPDTHSVCA